MYRKPERCPNPECAFSVPREDWQFIKKGKFIKRRDHQPVRRYKCKACGKFFCSNTFKTTYRQKKPDLNGQVFKFYASAMTQRRLAKCLGCDRKTVVAKFLFCARQARIKHQRLVESGKFKTDLVQFDEMETFEHTKFKPLSIALAVCAKSGLIIEAQVATMKAKGRGRSKDELPFKYKHSNAERPDTRPTAMDDVMLMIKRCARNETTLILESDSKRQYISAVRNVLPFAHYVQHLSRMVVKKKGKRQEIMARLNHTCTMIRHDLSRMARRTWVTTKASWALQAHLDLYIAWRNGYCLKI